MQTPRAPDGVERMERDVYFLFDISVVYANINGNADAKYCL